MSSSKKIVLVGHFGVGKSSLLRRFVLNQFSDSYTVTIGVHILKKEVVVRNQVVSLILWDIEGKDDIKKVRPSYLLGTSGFVYVIDPTRPQTYDDYNEQIKFIQTTYPNAAIVSVANKCDLIDHADFRKLLHEKNIPINYFASAKTGDTVDEMFQSLTEKIL